MEGAHLCSDTDRVGGRTESLAELETVVSLSGLSEERELARLSPVELARVDDHTSNGRSVAANPFGRTVHDNVRTELNRLDDVSSSTEGVIDDEGNAMVVCDLRESGDVVDDIFGVRDRLDVDGLGALVNGGGECFGGRLGDPLHANAEVLEGDLELVVGTAIEVGGRDDVVTGAGDRGDG